MLDARPFARAGVAAGTEFLNPLAQDSAQPFQCQSSMDRGKLFQLFEPLSEQRLCSRPVAARVMVKCGSHLDDALEKCFFRLGRGQPDLFPGFVGLEEASRIELFQALSELFFGFLWIHVPACAHALEAPELFCLSRGRETRHNSKLGLEGSAERRRADNG